MNALPMPTALRDDPGTARRWGALATVAVFVVVLIAPWAGLFRSSVDETIRRNENRTPAAFPTLEFSTHGFLAVPKKRSLQKFPRQFEAWFNDHRGLRRPLLNLYNLARVYGVVSDSLGRPAVGESARSPVLIGRDGWLFYTGDDLIADYRCTEPFTPEQLDRWKQALTARRDWLAARGIEYLFVVVPNKHSIYSEKLPRTVNRVRDASRLDQLLKHLAEPDGVEVVDLRQPLRDAKSQWPTYHRTDTHWNEFGAYIGYREILERVNHRLPGDAVWPLTDFDVRTQDGDGLYLARMVESPWPFREVVVDMVSRRVRWATADTITPPTSDAGRNFTSTHPYAERPNIVVLHDSFMMALGPYLCEHFSRIQFKWTREFPTALIEREQPALVIDEIVERRLMGDPPAAP